MSGQEPDNLSDRDLFLPFNYEILRPCFRQVPHARYRRSGTRVNSPFFRRTVRSRDSTFAPNSSARRCQRPGSTSDMSADFMRCQSGNDSARSWTSRTSTVIRRSGRLESEVEPDRGALRSDVAFLWEEAESERTGPVFRCRLEIPERAKAVEPEHGPKGRSSARSLLLVCAICREPARRPGPRENTR